MAATKFTRNKDYSDEADTNAGGRSTVDPTGLDGEMDELASVTDDHADKLDLLLRDDLKLQSDLIEGHEFSATAITALKALLNTGGALNWYGPWAVGVDYTTGDLVSESGNVYFCLGPHRSSFFLSDLSIMNFWQIFAEKGAGASFPVGATSNDLLFYNGATEAWGKLNTAMAPLFATKASPTFTGTVQLPTTKITGGLRYTIGGVTFAAGGNTFDFDTEFVKKVTVTGSYTGACSASNITVGDVMEVHFYNSSGASAALLWDAAWVWMGYKPSSLAAGKKAVLSLRVPTGSSAADVIAIWSVQP